VITMIFTCPNDYYGSRTAVDATLYLEGVHIREFIILVDFRIHFHVISYENGTISVLDSKSLLTVTRIAI
jgi:hypothetical protein